MVKVKEQVCSQISMYHSSLNKDHHSFGFGKVVIKVTDHGYSAKIGFQNKTNSESVNCFYTPRMYNFKKNPYDFGEKWFTVQFHNKCFSHHKPRSVLAE